MKPLDAIPGTDMAIEVEGLVKAYKRGKAGEVLAVNDVSFSARRNEVIGLLGANGAGKTTVIKCLSTLIRPDTGSIRICGLDAIAKPRAVTAHIASVLEGNRNIYWRLTPVENLRFFAGLHGISRRKAQPRIDELLTLFDLDGKASTQGRMLSRGMQQKLALASALVKETDVLLLDEPTLGLDVETSHELRRYLRQLAHQTGRTVLLSSHDMSLVEAVCERVVVIHRGRVVTDDRVSNLLELFRATGYSFTIKGRLPSGLEEGLRREFPLFELHTSDHTSAVTVDLRKPSHLYELVDQFRNAGLEIEAIDRQDPNLEQIFLSIVQEQGKADKADEDSHRLDRHLRAVLD
jgi:ABC-2 type transport system ATP-binding protein